MSVSLTGVAELRICRCDDNVIAEADDAYYYAQGRLGRRQWHNLLER